MDLRDKVALVTGGSQRVGLAIAKAFAREGCSLALHYNRSGEAAALAAKEIRTLGVRVELFQADLADPSQIEKLFAAVGKAFGRLDVLVNNAAVFHRTPFDTLTAEQFDAELAINARAPALCIRRAAAMMRPTGGAIVNITDIAAEKAWAGYPAYCASKAALLAITKSAARSLAGDNICVNAVAPGAILWSEQQSQAEKEQVLSQIPMKRIGRPEDIAQAVVFLASQQYITAQTLRVDGGWHMG